MSIGERAYPSNQGAVLGIPEGENYFNPSTEVSIKTHLNINLEKRCQLQNIAHLFVSKDNTGDFISWLNDVTAKDRTSISQESLVSSWTDNKKREAYIYNLSTLGNAWIVSDYDMIFMIV